MIEDIVVQEVAHELRMVAAAAEETSALGDLSFLVADIELVGEGANEIVELVPDAGIIAVDKVHIQHIVDNVVAGEANLKPSELPE